MKVNHQTFREIEKVPLAATVPQEIDDAVREVAFSERVSLSAATTRLLCLGLGLDPTAFGLAGGPATKKARRQPARTH